MKLGEIEKQNCFINSPFFCSEFQSISRIIVKSAQWQLSLLWKSYPSQVSWELLSIFWETLCPNSSGTFPSTYFAGGLKFPKNLGSSGIVFLPGPLEAGNLSHVLWERNHNCSLSRIQGKLSFLGHTHIVTDRKAMHV